MPAQPANVILVPGFGGTTLSYVGGFRGKTNYWYNPRALASTNPLAGALAVDGSSPYPGLGKTLFTGGPVDMGVYEPMLTALANGGFNAVFWGYDWRLSPVSTAAQLAAFLASPAVATSFQLVCHSFGGLVAQLAYATFLSAPGKNSWHQTVYCGTPWGGSYWAAAALAGWFPKGSELAVIASLFRLQPPVVPARSNPVYTALQTAIGTLVGSWPALYCLLPNYQGPWASSDTAAASLSLLSTYAKTYGGQQQAWFNLARTVFGSLVDALSAPRPLETTILGSGQNTLGTYDGPPAFPADLESYNNMDGDGTVTVQRGHNPGSGVYVELQGIGHNALMTSTASTQAVVGALSVPVVQETIEPFKPPVFVLPPTPLPPVNVTIPTNPFANTHSDP
jgi:hypothetical protein